MCAGALVSPPQVGIVVRQTDALCVSTHAREDRLFRFQVGKRRASWRGKEEKYTELDGCRNRAKSNCERSQRCFQLLHYSEIFWEKQVHFPFCCKLALMIGCTKALTFGWAHPAKMRCRSQPQGNLQLAAPVRAGSCHPCSKPRTRSCKRIPTWQARSPRHFIPGRVLLFFPLGFAAFQHTRQSSSYCASSKPPHVEVLKGRRHPKQGFPLLPSFAFFLF